uniref:NAD(P)(+)--arginine ADP-ribosyltransferase n=1 Tax=Junco hyemalis TaxID=40217 RepID=A0A8C5J4U4_JUNHY
MARKGHHELLPAMALLARTLALLAMTLAITAIKVVPLDMARDSFDDQYRGCSPAMMAVLPALHNFEFQVNPLFTQTWVKAEAEWRKRGSPVSPLASPAQAVALMAYTTKDIYKDFNAAVRVAGHSRQEYRNNFHFKTLHFLLTKALARRGQKVRFGQFTSTSLSKEVAQKYGTDTIFEVQTCHGVDIQAFSFYLSNQEVLIPPYETFKVTKITRNGKKAWITLRSSGTYSKHNSLAAPKEFHPFPRQLTSSFPDSDNPTRLLVGQHLKAPPVAPLAAGREPPRQPRPTLCFMVTESQDMLMLLMGPKGAKAWRMVFSPSS